MNYCVGSYDKNGVLLDSINAPSLGLARAMARGILRPMAFALVDHCVIFKLPAMEGLNMEMIEKVSR